MSFRIWPCRGVAMSLFVQDCLTFDVFSRNNLSVTRLSLSRRSWNMWSIISYLEYVGTHPKIRHWCVDIFWFCRFAPNSWPWDFHSQQLLYIVNDESRASNHADVLNFPEISQHIVYLRISAVGNGVFWACQSSNERSPPLRSRWSSCWNHWTSDARGPAWPSVTQCGIGSGGDPHRGIQVRCKIWESEDVGGLRVERRP